MGVLIVHVITDLSTGGSQNALASLLTRLDRGRFDPAAVCLKNGDTPIAARLRAAGIPVIDLNMSGAARAPRVWRLWSLLDEMRPSIVHAWLFHAVTAARIAARLAGVPAVISSRRNINLGSPIREFVNRATSGLDDRVAAVSESARLIEVSRARVSPEKVVVIPNGVDPGAYGAPTPETRAAVRRSLGLPPETTLLGFVGRLHPVKGVDDLLRAARPVLNRFPTARILVVGDGEDRARLERLSSEVGVTSGVLFLGERTDVAFLLGGLDVFVMPSREEGMPNAVLEAMAAGVPVVATTTGGTAELVVHGSSGLLVTPGDVEGLSSAMASLVEDRFLSERLAAAARARAAAAFSIEETVRRTEALYEEILREKLGHR
jgi:glycosyltransferase involved in cell wall biosynthesis